MSAHIYVNEDYNIIVSSGIFDVNYYLNEYDDVRNNNADPVLHYCNYGWKEGRNPSRYFNTVYYQSQLSSFEKRINPLVHYIKYGHKSGVRPCENLEGTFRILYRVVSYDEMNDSRKHPLDFGINVLGYFKGCFGLSENPRNIALALNKIRLPYVCNSTRSPAHPDIIRPHLVISKNNPFKINLDTINSSEDPVFILNYSGIDAYDYVRGRVIASVWATELDTIHPSMIKGSRNVDELFTISNFCRNSLSSGLNRDVIVLSMPIPELKESPVPDAKKFIQNVINRTIDDNTFVVGFIFDCFSDLVRKNPYDVVSVFENVMLKHENAILILKTMNTHANFQKFDELTRRIENSSTKDRIYVISARWSASEMSMFYSAINVYISLHRSEGQGITMLQCINKGIPVICTNYSGNTDFCHEFNSWPVDYHLVNVQPDTYQYTEFIGIADWAQPNVDQAAKHLEYIYHNYEQAKSKVLNSVDYIRSKYNHKRLGYEILASLIKYDQLYEKPTLVITFYVSSVGLISDYMQRITQLHQLFRVMVVIGYSDVNEEEIRNVCREIKYHLHHASEDTAIVDTLSYITNNNIQGDIYLNLNGRDHMDMLNPETLRLAAMYRNRDYKLGIIGPKGTVAPVYGERETLERVMNTLEMSTESLRLRKTLDDKFDYSVYTMANPDLPPMAEDEAINHWLNIGVGEGRVANKSSYERLMYSRYPLTVYSGTFVYTKELADYMTNWRAESIRKQTSTSIVKHLPGLLAISQHLHILTFEGERLKFYR